MNGSNQMNNNSNIKAKKVTKNAFSIMTKHSKKKKRNNANNNDNNNNNNIKKKQKRGNNNFNRNRKTIQIQSWKNDNRLLGNKQWGDKGKVLGWNLISGLSTVKGRNRVRSGDQL